MAFSLLEEVFTSLNAGKPWGMDTVLPSSGPFGEGGKALGGSGEEKKEGCVLQFGGLADAVPNRLTSVKGG